ncbi:MAG: GH25 family lysozyme [Nitrosomonas sp.]
MKNTEFILANFTGDTNTPPLDYVLEILEVNTKEKSFKCKIVDSSVEFTFSYANGADSPWAGTDAKGLNYELFSHQIFLSGKIDPYPQGVALLTFASGNHYLCYVDSINPKLELRVYFPAAYTIFIENNVVTYSDWDSYPSGTKIINVEGCTVISVPNSDKESTLPSAESKQYLFVDVYQDDLKGKPIWANLVQDPRFYGAIIKATEGIKYNGGSWFSANWQQLRNIVPKRYGKTWFRGAYLFLKFNQDGTKQADYYLDTIDAAGGWGEGDIIPIIDVELGNDGSKDPAKRNSNQDASAQQIIDCTMACAKQLRSRTGRRVMLYGRGAMRDRSITSKMGCDIVWNPSYTRTMVINGLSAWKLDDIALWQYCGDGVAGIEESKLPRTIPDFGKVDISVYIDGNKKPTLESLIERLGIGVTVP